MVYTLTMALFIVQSIYMYRVLHTTCSSSNFKGARTKLHEAKDEYVLLS